MLLITGSTGFIGKYLIDYLKLNFESREIIELSRGQSSSTSNIIDVNSVDGNTIWGDSLKNVDCIIHLAGLAHSKSYSFYDYKFVNTEGTLNLASEAVKSGVKRFVYVSSIGVNGSYTMNFPFLPTSDPNPHNNYAKSKYLAEVGLKEISERTGLEIVIVRPTLVYGLYAPGNFALLSKLVKNFPLFPFGLINNKRDFIAVQNLVDLLVICANHPNAANNTFLASDCETVSIADFTNAISKGYNKHVFQLPVPAAFIRLGGRLFRKSYLVEQLLGNLQVDSSNIQEILGWVPPYTMRQALASLTEIEND